MKQCNINYLKAAENKMVIIITIIMTAKNQGAPLTVVRAVFVLSTMFPQ